MKVEHTKMLIPLLQAYAEGKTIEMYCPKRVDKE